MARKKSELILILSLITLFSVHAADWRVFQYRDEFDTSTEVRAISSMNWEEGTFSNASTSNSNLYWTLEINLDTEKSYVILREYSPANPTYSHQGYTYKIHVKTEDGRIEDYEGIEENGKIGIVEGLSQPSFYSLIASSESIAIDIEHGDSEYRLGTLNDIALIHSILNAESETVAAEQIRNPEFRNNTVGVSIGHKAFKLTGTGKVHHVNATDLTYIRYLWNSNTNGIGLRLDTAALSMETSNYQFYPMANIELSFYARFSYLGIGIGCGYYHWMNENIDMFTVMIPIDIIFPIGNDISLGLSATPYFPIGNKVKADGILDMDICLTGFLRYDF